MHQEVLCTDLLEENVLSGVRQGNIGSGRSGSVHTRNGESFQEWLFCGAAEFLYYKGVDIDRTKDYTAEIAKVGPKGTFLYGRTPKEYRKEHFIPDIFVKTDYKAWENDGSVSIKDRASQVVKNRIESYKAPEITPEQMKVIEKYL